MLLIFALQAIHYLLYSCLPREAFFPGQLLAQRLPKRRSICSVSINRFRKSSVLGQVDFMSSAGLRAILLALKESRRQGGDLRLAAARPGVDYTLKISGLASILQSFPSVDQAVASFGPGPI